MNNCLLLSNIHEILILITIQPFIQILAQVVFKVLENTLRAMYLYPSQNLV